jgi:hypothetical protein
MRRTIHRRCSLLPLLSPLIRVGPRRLPAIFCGALFGAIALVRVVAATSLATHPETLVIVAPLSWQVIQRSQPSAEDRGAATVRVVVAGTVLQDAGGVAEVRVLPSATGAAAGASPESAGPTSAAWRALPLVRSDAAALAPPQASAEVVVAAGGWYRLEVRWRGRDGATQVAAVEPLAVGEVFLVAGQSYATNTNDERLHVTDPGRRVSAFNVETGTWQLADDPQPAPDRSQNGSIWPPVGDQLARALGVPIGFVNVAVGGTSTRQWMPTEPLSVRLHQAGRTICRFRAVLWQQGESDVLADTPTADYVSRLRQIRDAAVEAWGFAPPWICALSTHHPTVYRKPEAEARIREAITQVSRLPGFALGPDTDQLQGPNRGGPQSRRHFSALGQRNAAGLWAAVLLRQLPAAGP